MNKKIIIIIGIIAIASVFVIIPVISYDLWQNNMEEEKVEPDEYELKLNHFRTLDCNLFEPNRVDSDLIVNNAYQQRQEECVQGFDRAEP